MLGPDLLERERQEDSSATALASAGLEERSIVGSGLPRRSLHNVSEVAKGNSALPLRAKSRAARGICLELTAELRCLPLLWRVCASLYDVG